LWLSLVKSEAAERVRPKAIDEQAILLQAGALLFLTATCLALLSTVFRASVVDLGLPTSWRQARRDVAVGVTACLASLLPIYLLLMALSMLVDSTKGHPLVEQFEQSPSLAALAALAVTALVAAPVSEEISFRLVFQGWLERIEGRREVAESPPPADIDEFLVEAIPDFRPSWKPMAISALVFGAAHVGAGVAPIPLAVLGLVLGYLYWRTHRVLPCIACHTTFNAVAVCGAWLQYG
jgi:membrane protease YdiL (CAAX protease family)